MTAPRTVRGIRDSIPQGHIIGRSSSGSGAPELISLKDLAAQLSKTGSVIPAPGSTPVVSGGPSVLFTATTRPGNGADITEDTLFSIAIPANTLLNVGDRLRLTGFVSFANLAHSMGALYRWGNNSTVTSNPTASGIAASTGNQNKALFTQIEITKTAANTQIIDYVEHLTTNGTFGTASSVVKPHGSFTATDTATIFLSLTGQTGTASANDVVCEGLTVELWPAP